MIFGYARVSTSSQQASLDAQVTALREAGAEEVVTDMFSGARASRPGLDGLRAKLRPGDVVMVTKLDRLGRSLIDNLTTITDLADNGVTMKSFDLDIDTSTSSGRMVLGVMSLLAEYERDRLAERTREGLEHARSSGKKLGRPRALSPEAVASVVASFESGMKITELAKMHGVSRMTIRNAIHEASGSMP